MVRGRLRGRRRVGMRNRFGRGYGVASGRCVEKHYLLMIDAERDESRTSCKRAALHTR